MNTTEKAARHVATTAGPAKQAVQEQVYPTQTRQATGSRLEQAAEVLCLLAFFPLTETARIGFFALLDRRLRQAYEGVTR